MADVVTGGGSALSPLPLSGGRRRSHKKLRLVKKKTVRRMLARQGLKMRGGAGEAAPAPAADGAAPATGGRRHRRSHRRSRRGKFLGMF